MVDLKRMRPYWHNGKMYVGDALLTKSQWILLDQRVLKYFQQIDFTPPKYTADECELQLVRFQYKQSDTLVWALNEALALLLSWTEFNVSPTVIHNDRYEFFIALSGRWSNG